MLEFFPAWLRRPGPHDVLVWQWIALPIVFAAAWFLGRIGALITRRIINRIAERHDRKWDDTLQRRLSSPITFGWGLFVVYVALRWLELAADATHFVDRVLVAGGLIAFFWTLLRAVDVAAEHILDHEAAQTNAATRSLVPLGSKALKIVVFAMAVIAALNELGYPVTSLIAGLGIGGVALALAAQKTGENLFGSIAIGIDQPFRVGDVIQIDGLSGTVEAIGLRSTRVRTNDRTLVTIPNGKLADQRIECVSARDRIGFTCIVALEHGTKTAVVRDVMQKIEKSLRDDPKVRSETINVVLARLGVSFLEIEVTGAFSVTTVEEFGALRQAMLLRCLDIVHGAGAEVALPGQTLHIASLPADKTSPAAASKST